jgi:hypothetical protein
MPDRTRAELARQPRPHAAPGTPEPATDSLLWLQRQAGNAAVADLLGRRPTIAREAGGTQPVPAPAPPPASAEAPAATKVKHLSGKQVDKYLLANSLLKPFVEPKMKAGTTGESAVRIEGGADFKVAWIAYAVGRENPRTGHPFTQPEADAWEPKVNAFQDAGAIHVHEARGDPGTTLHETLHLLSDSGFADFAGYNLNEGVTDYFTHLVAGQHKIERTYNFPRQVFVVDRLIRITSPQKLADAYFKNNIDGIKADIEAKGAGNWAKWLAAVQAGDFPEATKLVK